MHTPYSILHTTKRGFTIIELLVVIAIISLLASIVFISVTSTQARSRDARREADIKEIQNAVNLYAVNNRAFPACGSEVVINGSNDCLSTQILAAGAISQVPVDPLGKASGTCGDPTGYVYCYVSDGTSFALRHHLETNTIEGKAAGWQSVGP